MGILSPKFEVYLEDFILECIFFLQFFLFLVNMV